MLESEEESYVHAYHHDGAGSGALMIAHDAFLPESMGSDSMVSLRVAANHDEHHDHGGFAARRESRLRELFGSTPGTADASVIAADPQKVYSNHM